MPLRRAHQLECPGNKAKEKSISSSVVGIFHIMPAKAELTSVKSKREVKQSMSDLRVVDVGKDGRTLRESAGIGWEHNLRTERSERQDGDLARGRRKHDNAAQRGDVRHSP